MSARSLPLPWQLTLARYAPLVLSAAALLYLVTAQPGPVASVTAGLLVLSVSVVLALRAPLATLALCLVLGQLVDLDLAGLESLNLVRVAGYRLRYFDPLLFGIVAATGVRLLTRDPRLYRFIWGKGLLWTLLGGWLGGVALWSVQGYGVAASLGALRTFYGPLLLILYGYVFLPEPKQGLKIIAFCSALFVIAPLGELLEQGSLIVGQRWFSASSNLALLTGITLLLILKRSLFKRLPFLLLPVLGVPVALSLLNTHRSVWLAAGITLVLLTFAAGTKRRVLALLFVLGIASGLSAAILTLFGPDEGLRAFAVQRLAAFTNTSADPSSVHRLTMWWQSFDSITAHPLTGLGIADNFSYTLANGNLTQHNPHNLYILLAYQAGLVGLVLYLIALGQSLTTVFRSARLSLNDRRLLLLGSGILIIAVHAYYMAYVLDYVTPLVLGLALRLTDD